MEAKGGRVIHRGDKENSQLSCEQKSHCWGKQCNQALPQCLKKYVDSKPGLLKVMMQLTLYAIAIYRVRNGFYFFVGNVSRRCKF